MGMLFVLAMVWWKVQPPWWDNAGDIAEMEGFLQDGRGYEGIDEYVPRGADPYEVQRSAPSISVANDRKAEADVQTWAPESKRFTVKASEAEDVTLRLFNYPAWVVEVNDRIVEAGTHETTGQMVIPVPAGESHVRLTFVRTRDRTLGIAISLFALPLVGGLAVWEKRKRRRPA
jgi:hypothetical protein